MTAAVVPKEPALKKEDEQPSFATASFAGIVPSLLSFTSLVPSAPAWGANYGDFTSRTATVAVHVSETTEAQRGSLGDHHADWQPRHVYGFLIEQLRSDDTPFEVVTDAAMAAGALMNGGSPKYAILFTLANDCISDATAARQFTAIGSVIDPTNGHDSREFSPVSR